MSKKSRANKAMRAVEAISAPTQGEQEANARLHDAAKAINEQAKVTKRTKAPSATLAGLPPLPKLPASARKPKPSKSCECGCAQPTKGGRFIPGHDARLHGWALRVERGVITVDQVPAPHTQAVRALLAGKTVKTT